MTHFLAVDWDSVELRAVLATSQRGLIKVLKAESAPLEFGESTDETPQPDIALTLKNLVKRERIPRAKLLLGLNRASVDMMTFTLPKSKPEELPDLVKNQALRDSPGFSETSPIDFISGPASDSDNIRAIAATITRAQLKKYRAIGQAVGMRAKRVEFRPLGLAELYLRSNPVVDQPVLLVQCTTSEVDMVVVEETNIVLVRSIKLPDSLEKEERTRRIAAEIMRTIAVSRQEIEGTALERVILYGETAEYLPLQEQLTDQELETLVQNPFRLPCVQTPTRAKIADATTTPGHYAALFGMVLSEQSKSPARIDFLHPREKPQPLNIARFAVLFLLLVGAIGFAAWHINRQYLKGLEEQRAELNTDIEALQMEYRQNFPNYARQFQAYMWESQQLIWLDELRDISVRLPDEQDIVITEMQYSHAGGNLGNIDLQGRARNVNVLHQIVRSFNDNYHRAQITQQVPSRSGGGYQVGFSIRIMTSRQPYAAFWQRLSPELRQLSNVAPDFPKDEPQQSDTEQNTPSQPETVTTPQTQQQTADQTPAIKPEMRHVFPPNYVPKPAPQNQGQENTADETTSTETQEKPELPHVTPPQYVPQTQVVKPVQAHVLPNGYVPLSNHGNGSATERSPQRHVLPGGYLPKDAVQVPGNEPENDAATTEGGAA